MRIKDNRGGKGAKGQSLQITETSDGKVTTAIIKSPEVTEDHQENAIDTAELENPPLPSKFDTDDFGSNIRNIQKTAAEIIKLQEIAKKTGLLSESQETQYQEGMENLSRTALKLANMQDESNPSVIENREGLSAWFERKMPNKNTDKNKEEDKKKKDSEKKKKEEEAKRKESEQKKKQEEEKRRKDEENDKKQEEEEVAQETDDDDDTIGIDLPDKDASVAEAKPVGLAIAGEGGVAASKPIATAVVGRGGLAIARPVGTAIAGIDPKDPLYPTYIENYVHGGKTKIVSSTNSNKQDSANEYLNRLISKYHQN